MSIKYNKSLATTAAIFLSLISLQSFAQDAKKKNSHDHDHDDKHDHKHAPKLSKADKDASKGIFEDQAVKDRELKDWDGKWQSAYPYLLNGDLEPVFISKAKKDPEKTLEEHREYYTKGYKTNIDKITIENNIIDFYSADIVNSCKYTYTSFKIMTYKSGKKGVRYLFECLDANSKAPKFIQFSDHIIGPKKSDHFHIYMGNESHEKLFEEMGNWPTFYPSSLDKKGIVHDMLHH